MSADNVIGPPTTLPHRSSGLRRMARIFLVVGSIAALALFASGAIWHFLYPTPRPPEVNLDGIDPAIVAAVEEARDQLKDSPRSASAWGKLGTVLVVHEFRPEGNYCLQQAERLDPREARWPYIQALDALLANDLQTALPKLERAVSLCGNVPDAPRVRLAETYLSQNRLDDAEREFRLLLQNDPRHARAQLGLARILWQRNDPRSSLEMLATAQYDMHTRKAACILMAQVQQQLGHSQAAEAARQRAANLPEDPFPTDSYNEEAISLRTGKDAWIKRARRLSEIGKEDEALALLRTTVKTYPNADDAWRQLGKIQLKQKDAPFAELALRRAYELAPEMFENVYYLASALVVQGKTPEAITYFRKTTELKPDFAPAWHDLGRALADSKDPEGAMAAFRSAIRYDPNLFGAHFNLALLLKECGQYAAALVHVQNALKLRPADANARKLVEKLAPALLLPLAFP